MWRIEHWVLSALLFAAVSAQATCFDQAADYYQVPEILLRAIAYHESGNNPKLVHTNPSGSKDIGLMQINEWWLPKLGPLGIGREDLFDGCVNAFVGAWVLAQNIRRADGDVWKAVGAYNAGWRPGAERDRRRSAYIRSIRRIVERLRAQDTAAATAQTETSRERTS